MHAYQAIANTIRTKVDKGDFGQRLPTIDDLAREYGVSRKTVQKAIGLLKEENVIKASPKRGISPTRLKRPKSHVLGGVLLSSHRGHLHHQLIGGMQDEAVGHKEVIALAPGTKGDAQLEVPQIQSLLDTQKVDGIILWPSFAPGISPGVEYLKSEKVPFVLVGQAPAHIYHDCHTVNSNDVTGGAELMTHLLGVGHKQIAFTADLDNADSDYTKVRYEQYVRSMELAGLEPLKLIVLDREMEKTRPFKEVSALFCTTDYTLLRLWKMCNRNRIRIPEDLAVAGFDNQQAMEELDITSVDQHMNQVGRIAVELLLREINSDTEEPEHHVVDSELVLRGSSQLVR